MRFRTPAIGSVEPARPLVGAQRHDTRMLLLWTTLGFVVVLAVLGLTGVAPFVLTLDIADGGITAVIAATLGYWWAIWPVRSGMGGPRRT